MRGWFVSLCCGAASGVRPPESPGECGRVPSRRNASSRPSRQVAFTLPSNLCEAGTHGCVRARTHTRLRTREAGFARRGRCRSSSARPPSRELAFRPPISARVYTHKRTYMDVQREEEIVAAATGGFEVAFSTLDPALSIAHLRCRPSGSRPNGSNIETEASFTTVSHYR